MDQPTFEVIAVHKITDTDRQGVYELDVTFSINGVLDRHENYVSAPDDPHGANPAVRAWMSKNPDVPVHAYVPPPPPTKAEARAQMPRLTARQLRLGLVNAGISPMQVTNTLAAMPASPEAEKAQIEWEYATEFNRLHPLIATVGTQLNLTADQIDTMWLASVNL